MGNPVRSVSGTNIAVVFTDRVLLVDNTAAVASIQLPSPSLRIETPLSIYCLGNPASHAVTLIRAGTESIEGAASSFTMVATAISLSTNGTNWYMVPTVAAATETASSIRAVSGTSIAVNSTDRVLLVDNSAAVASIQLPAPATWIHPLIIIAKVSPAAAANAVTLLRSGSETIDGAASNAVFYEQSITLTSDLTNWWSSSRVARTVYQTIISPTALSGNVNNYTPTDWVSAQVVRLTSDAARSITGWGNGAVYPKLILNANTDVTRVITLVHDSASSTAAGRMYCPGGVDYSLKAQAQGSSAVMWFDTAAQRIQIISVASIGTGDALTSATLAQFAATTSAQLRGVLSDETGTGAAVFATSPTLTTPVIADFSTAVHDHTNAAGGGTLPASAISSGTIDTARLGSGTADATTFLRGDQTYSIPAGTGDMVLAATQTVTGAKTFGGPAGIAKLLVGGFTSGAISIQAPNVAGSGGIILPLNGTLATLGGVETLANKNLTAPTIANFASAQHTHADATGGGTLNASTILAGTMATARLGSGTANNTSFLRGDSTWQVISGGGGDALTANPLSQFASTTSAQLRGVLSDETGTGAAVFATSPTLVTPVLGAATATSLALGTGKVTGMGDPTSAQDAATKTYVDSAAGFLPAITPTTIGSSQNNYNPAGWDTARVVFISASTTVAITGFAASNTPKLLIPSGGNIIGLAHENTSSSAANRIHTSSYSGPPYNQATPTVYGLLDNPVLIVYDTTATRWKFASITSDQAAMDYVIANYVNRGGDSMTGNLSMGSHLISNVTDPASAQDAATKNYVDTAAFANAITPTAIGADQNNYSPTGWSTATLVHLSASTTVVITGFAASNTPKLLIPSGSNIMALQHESTSSSAANRIHVPSYSGAPYNEAAPTAYALLDNPVWIVYDSTAARWKFASITVDQGIYNAVALKFLDKTGDSMTGNLGMGSNRISSLLDPSSAQDAATKNYVDTLVANTLIKTSYSPRVSITSTATPVSGTAHFCYLGYFATSVAVTGALLNVQIVGVGAQTAEIGLFTTPVGPNGTAQTLTKVSAQSLAANLTVLGSHIETVAWTLSGHCYTGIRTAMATTQPRLGGIIDQQFLGEGYIIAASGALTSFTSGAGTLATLSVGNFAALSLIV